MQITFENIMDKVVKSRTLSRKDKQDAIREFLKANCAETDEQTEIVEKLKSIRKSYSVQDVKERVTSSSSANY